MTDLPENIDQQWISKTLLAIQREVRSLRDDMTVTIAILTRIESFVEPPEETVESKD